MEKLIYKNQLGESVEISATPPFLLERKEGFGAIKNKIGTSNSYGQDGETVVNESLEKRDMSIEGNILARSREELLRLRRKLVRVFNPKASGKLTYENDIGVWEIYCKVECAPVFPYENYEITQKFLIQLMGPNPLWKDLKEHETTLVTWVPNLEFPIEQGEGKEFFHTEQTPNYWLETSEINVKGRNLIKNSGEFKDLNHWEATHGKLTIQDDYLSWNCNNFSDWGAWLGNHSLRNIPFDVNKNYTISFEAKIDKSQDVRVRICDRNAENLVWYTKCNIDADWQRFVYTFKPQAIGHERIVNFITPKSEPYILDIRNIKLEEGNSSKSWTPAPEDSEFEEFQSEFGHGIGQEWGYRVLKQIVEVDNIGDVECPLRVIFRASGDVEKPYIQNVESYELIRINKTLKSGDVLEITTGYGEKNVYLNGKKAHQYLDFLNSSWLQLKPGINLIKYGAENNLHNLECTVFYTPLYLGV